MMNRQVCPIHCKGGQKRRSERSIKVLQSFRLPHLEALICRRRRGTGTESLVAG